MTAPQSLLQAAVQRIGSRLGSGLVDVAASVALLVQDAPERIRQEWLLFCEEVELEAERIERGDPGSAAASVDQPASRPDSQQPVDPQDQIDALRAKVAEMARRLDQPS